MTDLKGSTPHATPTPDAAGPATRRAGNRRFTLGTAGGVVVGILAITGALSAIPPRTAPVATPAPAASTTTTTKASSATPTTPVISSLVPATPNPSTGIATPSGAPTTPAATPPAGGQVLTSLDRGSYVAVFQWLNKNKYTEADAVAFAASHQKAGFTVVALEGSLVQKTGSWGIGVTGLADFTAATAACKAMGFSTNGSDCYRRMVTR